MMKVNHYIPIHQLVKDRYWERMKVHGRGLLDAKEKNNDIYNKTIKNG